MNKEEIKELRAKMKLSQEKMARLVNVSMQSYQKWEKGTQRPQALAIEKLNSIKGEYERSNSHISSETKNP